jgi:hypothetical protein
MQTLYVDLRKTTSGHAGSIDDQMSWKDLSSVFQRIADASFDTGDTFDKGLRFDATSLNLTVFLTGHGNVLTDANAIDVDMVRCSHGSFVRFKSYEPVTNGLAAITSTATVGPSASRYFMRFTNAINLAIEFDGVLFDVKNTAEIYSLVRMESCVSSSVSFKNCVGSVNGSSLKFIDVAGADTTSYAMMVNNTLAYGSQAVGQHEIARTEGCNLTFARNVIAQATTSASQLICATSTLSIMGGGNALATNASSILYNAVSPSLIESDSIGLNVLKQLLWNPITIDGNKEDHLADVDTGVSFVRCGVFQLVHQSPAQKSGTNVKFSFTHVDAFGYDRAAGSVDAGAFQKSSLNADITLHVDLSLTGHTQNSGDEANPITLSDWATDYARRAPVDCNFSYVLRNTNSQIIHTFDLGPISSNSTALSTRYSGTGKMSITAYKPYRNALPVFNIRKEPRRNHYDINSFISHEFI